MSRSGIQLRCTSISAVASKAASSSASSAGSHSESSSAAASATAKMRAWLPVMVHRPPRVASRRAAVGASPAARARRSTSVRLFSSASSTRTVLHLVGREEHRPVGGGEVGRPPVPGRQRRGVVAGLDEAQPGELADRLEHPEPGHPVDLGDRDDRLVGQRLDQLHAVGVRGRSWRRGVEAVVEDRQPGRGVALGRQQQVPRPLDDGGQGAVPRRRRAVAAAQRAEPVVEGGPQLLHRHRPHPGGGQLDGERAGRRGVRRPPPPCRGRG